MGAIKFSQTMGDVVEGKVYPIIKTFEDEVFTHFYFTDDKGEECVVKTVKGVDCTTFFVVTK